MRDLQTVIVPKGIAKIQIRILDINIFTLFKGAFAVGRPIKPTVFHHQISRTITGSFFIHLLIFYSHCSSSFLRKTKLVIQALLMFYNHCEAQESNLFSETESLKRMPMTTLDPGASLCMFSEEFPISLPPEVANGTTVFPPKS